MPEISQTQRLEPPVYYHRQYDNDAQELVPAHPLLQQCKRVALAALPFLSLYKPLGMVLSLAMNGTRSFS